MYLDLITIVLIVLLVFQSGFMTSLRNGVAHLLDTKPEYIKTRPIWCPLCNSFWSQIIYLIITHQLSLLSILVALILSNCMDVFEELFYTIKELILRFIKMFQQ